MQIGERIQQLRKQKGLSQEELGEQVGVSRQAVSKWESGQSMPEADKLILLRECLETTTDYILTGEEPVRSGPEKENIAGVFLFGATALNFIGLATACAIWYEKQTAVAFLAGLALMALGCSVFFLGLLRAGSKGKSLAKQKFWVGNIWLLAFMPLSFVYNLLLGSTAAPYPLLMQPLAAYPVFWLVYGSICLGTVCWQLKKGRKR